ncbi:glycosyltransferase [Cannes 8 virus]|uniref:Glycosyltransferase n=1 Tax=Marseillevirus marseillevirus TaxID=694581 RepID=D2XAX0_GBMV|nr:glycosyltransferase [Marseillevirus marseillevirus]YP_009094791.1 conserved putative glycosyltransferase [Melbournevirus]AGV01693.1 glycosyltransferase [Cannes 8 virus]AVR53041.1 glycosyltransferase [Marseillevirus Shanghai 1]ADB04097.1 glycosyltransferase [Marseillevirus marseillevirus]AIT54903.1 glycosyltransferase [Melbournevirus]
MRKVRFSTPKILHQTWKSKELPESCKDLVGTWRNMFPDFEYKFYLDEDLRDVVKKYVPQHLSLYDAMSKNIERVDFARYAILYGVGGIYADIDTAPLRRIDPWLEKGKIILGREPLEHSRTLYGREVVLCNAFMISPPKEEMWLKLMDFIADNYDPKNDVLENTGPMALTRFFEEYPDAFKNVVITDPCAFFSLSNGFTDKEQLGFKGVSRFCDLLNPTCEEKIPYVVHLWHNEWLNYPGKNAIKNAMKKLTTSKEKKKVVAKCGVKKEKSLLFVVGIGIGLIFLLLVMRR